MSEHLTGSVGIVRPGSTWRSGAPVGNKPSDQRSVIKLLASIPSAQGGMKEEWGTPPLEGANGTCPPALADAIWKFQSHWKANGTFKNIDGVVDPGGNTLRVMNTLLLGTKIIQQGGANAPTPAAGNNLTNLAQKLRAAFPAASRWTLTNAPGIGAGFIASGQVGQLDVKEDGAAEERHLTFASGGAEMGWSPEGTSPVTFSASTRDMWSVSGMGRIYSRVPALTFDDMCGPLAILGITGAAPMKFYTDVAETLGGKMIQGLSFNVFLLGIQGSGKDALMRLPGTGNLTSGLMNAAQDCKAICMSAGEVLGLDLSIGVTIGYATGMFGKWEFLDQVHNNEAKAAYDNAKKTVTDTLNTAKDNAWERLKDWSPF